LTVAATASRATTQCSCCLYTIQWRPSGSKQSSEQAPRRNRTTIKITRRRGLPWRVYGTSPALRSLL